MTIPRSAWRSVDTKVAAAERARFEQLRDQVRSADDELGRLEAVMYIRTLYLACFGYRRALTNGSTFNEWGFVEPPGYFSSTAAATRAAFRR
jgi:hypothetical protein